MNDFDFSDTVDCPPIRWAVDVDDHAPTRLDDRLARMGDKLDVRERLITIEGRLSALKNETRYPVHNKLSAHVTASTIFDFDQS